MTTTRFPTLFRLLPFAFALLVVTAALPGADAYRIPESKCYKGCIQFNGCTTDLVWAETADGLTLVSTETGLVVAYVVYVLTQPVVIINLVGETLDLAFGTTGATLTFTFDSTGNVFVFVNCAV